MSSVTLYEPSPFPENISIALANSVIAPLFLSEELFVSDSKNTFFSETLYSKKYPQNKQMTLKTEVFQNALCISEFSSLRITRLTTRQHRSVIKK